MKISIQGHPKFTFNFTKAQIAALTICAELHYDGACKGLKDTVIRTANNSFGYNEDNNPDEATMYDLEFRDLDIMCKTMEMRRVCGLSDEQLALMNDLATTFQTALGMANKHAKNWKVESCCE